jgi:hypothetical protein
MWLQVLKYISRAMLPGRRNFITSLFKGRKLPRTFSRLLWGFGVLPSEKVKIANSDRTTFKTCTWLASANSALGENRCQWRRAELRLRFSLSRLRVIFVVKLFHRRKVSQKARVVLNVERERTQHASRAPTSSSTLSKRSKYCVERQPRADDAAAIYLYRRKFNEVLYKHRLV